MAMAGPFSVGSIDSSDAGSSFNRSFTDAATCFSIIVAVARACRLASDREPAAAALLSVAGLVVTAASWLANGVMPSPTGLANEVTAADSDDMLPTASDDQFVVSVNAGDLSTAKTKLTLHDDHEIPDFACPSLASQISDHARKDSNYENVYKTEEKCPRGFMLMTCHD